MNWWQELKDEMQAMGDSFPPIFCTLPEEEMRKEFDGSYGIAEGKPFTAWGENWVYFPLEYDGSERIGRAPRNPCNISLEHQ